MKPINHGVGVEIELNQDISRRVMEHRNRFRRLIFNRYVEFLPLLINYTNKNTVSINFLQLETGLRQGYQVVIGKARNEEIMILGYIHNHYYKNSEDYFNHFNFSTEYRLTEKDIIYTIPEYLRPDYALEIQHYDNARSGDFIVMRNKPVNLSNDETVKQIITQLFNESPFIKTDGYFDAEEDIIELESDYVVNALSEMKREYQNKSSELSNFLGINSLAVDKESGVSDTEANSN